MKRLGLILAAGLFFAGCEDATRPDAVAVSPDVTPTGASGGYEMIDLGTLGGTWSVAIAINNRGQVAGQSETATGEVKFFLWENGVMTDLGHLGGNRTEAVAINNRGQVVGNSETATGEKRPFLWENGVMTDLGAPSVPSGAKDINERGQVIGDSVPGQPGRAFLWENGVTTDLGSLGGIWVSAWDINERGQVTGVSATGTGDDFHAFVWADAVMTDLGPPGNPSAALAINERGQMVGLIFTGPGECGVYSESQRCRATLWTPKN